ncbi:MAG: glycosyltransferase [Acidimicrobiales bacterium]|nr:glycosyltransferase [Acidimicrobiales bacterium]
MPADASGPSDAPELSVVLPAHNEQDILEATISTLVAGLRRTGTAFEILIVENGSTDGTARLAADLAAAHAEVSAVSDPRPDYGKALRRGLLEARAAIVVNFDVDYYDLEFLRRASDMIRSGQAGVVVGSKRGAGSEDTRPLPRRLVTGGFALLLRVGFGLRASDTHGMKALDRVALAPLAEHCQLGTDLFDTELVLRAERAGIVVAEIPVRVEEVRPARSPIARRILRTVGGLRKLRVALREE